MRRSVALVLSATLLLTSVPVALSQGIDPDAAQVSPKVQRVGNESVHPKRRQLREQARGRQTFESNDFLEYRFHYRELQRKRTLENISPEQRRARLLERQKELPGSTVERIGDKLMEVHERLAPERASRIPYEPSNLRNRVGNVRLRTEHDSCRDVLGTRRSRCYYELQRASIPGS